MTSDRYQIWHTDREYDGAVWLPYVLDFYWQFYEN